MWVDQKSSDSSLQGSKSNVDLTFFCDLVFVWGKLSLGSKVFFNTLYFSLPEYIPPPVPQVGRRFVNIGVQLNNMIITVLTCGYNISMLIFIILHYCSQVFTREHIVKCSGIGMVRYSVYLLCYPGKQLYIFFVYYQNIMFYFQFLQL